MEDVSLTVVVVRELRELERVCKSLKSTDDFGCIESRYEMDTHTHTHSYKEFLSQSSLQRHFCITKLSYYDLTQSLPLYFDA